MRETTKALLVFQKWVVEMLKLFANVFVNKSWAEAEVVVDTT